MLFFTLPNSQNASVMSGGGFFNTTKFRYSGRTEREILSEGINALREQKLANSSPSKRKANSVPATPSSPQGDLAEIRKFIQIMMRIGWMPCRTRHNVCSIFNLCTIHWIRGVLRLRTYYLLIVIKLCCALWAFTFDNGNSRFGKSRDFRSKS